MKQFEVITASFTPQRIDDLQDDARDHVGKVYDWCASWIIEGGPYDGQWAMAPRPKDSVWPSIGWVPECDLTTIVEL